MTLREVQIALNQIGIRSQHKMEFDAKLHNFKVTFKGKRVDNKSTGEFSDEDRKKADEALERALARRANQRTG